jgi:hypothetical protein
LKFRFKKEKPICAPPSAKHRVWTFENQKKGTVGKSTTSIVKFLMAGADFKMRRLGPLVEALEESPPLLILEGEGDSTLQDNKVLEAIYE